MRLVTKRRFGWAGLVLLLAGCNNPGAATTSPNFGAVTNADANGVVSHAIPSRWIRALS